LQGGRFAGLDATRDFHHGLLTAMPWIKTVPPSSDAPEVLAHVQALAALYPKEYAPGERAGGRVPAAVRNESIVLSHSLSPKAMFHAFATFGELMDPALPLSRRQHEMIATTVSALNRCFY
jgi:hypothetical protein